MQCECVCGGGEESLFHLQNLISHVQQTALSYNNQQFEVLLILSGDKHSSLIGVLSIQCMFTCYLYVSESRDNRAQIIASQTGIAASHITGQRADY